MTDQINTNEKTATSPVDIERQKAFEELLTDIKALRIKVRVQLRDVRISKNPLGSMTSIGVFLKHVLIPYPMHVLRHLSTLLSSLWAFTMAGAYILLAIGVFITGVTIVPAMLALASLFGAITIRPSAASVKDAYLEAINALPSYQRYRKAGGTLDLEAMQVSAEFLNNLERVANSRTDEQ